MVHPACRRSAAAVLLVLAALAAVAAPTSATPQDAVFNAVLNGLVAWSKDPLAGVPPTNSSTAVSAAAAMPAPAGVTGRMVAQATASIIMAASVVAEAQSSLGAPRQWPYTDGSGRHALFRLPVTGTPKGTCIFIHGCKHDPESWFYKSDTCPQCTGLPEEVSHTKQCLAHGFAVLALMSKDRNYRTRCFSTSGDPNLSDAPSARDLVVAWTTHYGLQNKPKYMFGVSAGASFADKFPKTMYIDGIVSEVDAPDLKSWDATDSSGRFKVPFPPTAYYMMARDPETKGKILDAIKVYNFNNVPAQYIYLKALRITPDYFSQRSKYLTPLLSATLVRALKQIGVVNPITGYINYDTRFNRTWIPKLYARLKWLSPTSPYYNLISDESQIFEELNKAFAQHEIASDYVRATLVWLDLKGKASLNDLAAKYNLNGDIACLTESKEGC